MIDKHQTKIHTCRLVQPTSEVVPKIFTLYFNFFERATVRLKEKEPLSFQPQNKVKQRTSFKHFNIRLYAFKLD